MPPPLHIVFNLGSGHGDAEATRTRIADACAAAGRSVRLIEVLDPRQLPDLAAQAVRAARADGGIVVAAGGDGTINAVAQAVLGSGCTFGVLPQGTFNYFSRAHGIPDDLDAALQLLLTGRPQPVQVGLVNGRVFLSMPAWACTRACWRTAKPGSASWAAAGWWPASPCWPRCCGATAACA